jgi:adenine-specific DNA-methyltransferase
VFDWVDWMLELTTAARRSCSGDVVWVVNGCFDAGFYGPACEGLVWRWYTERAAKGDPVGKLERPCIWTKNSPPNRSDWFGNDWEFVLCFPSPGRRRVWHPERIATPPKFETGGRFSQRGPDGARKPGGAYPTNELTRPRDVLRATVGGGHMGHPRAHDNEAPYPMRLIEPLILALTEPGDVVADPFVGSGTTTHAAVVNGRGFVGGDVRESQVRLTRERMGTVAGW